MALLGLETIDGKVPLSPQLIAAALIVLLAVYTTTIILTRKTTSLDTLPRVGENQDEWFSRLRSSFRSLSNMRSMSDQGYNKFSRLNQIFIAPNFLTGPEVMLPPSDMARVLAEPENVLSVDEVHKEAIQQQYTLGHPRVMGYPLHVEIIQRQLTQNLRKLTGSLAEELEMGFVELWGSDTEGWREVNVMESMLKIVARTSNRVFVGVPLCRNDEFLENSVQYAQAFFGSGMIISQFPKWLRPVVGPIIATSNRRILAKCYKHSKPIILERLALMERKMSDPECRDMEMPNDYLQWQIEESYKRNDPVERDPDIISRRLQTVNSVALHTSSITSTNVIFDMYSLPNSETFVGGLREEIERVLAEEGGNWTKAGLGKMTRLDSTIKETMRWSGMDLRGLQRIVRDPAGVKFGKVRLPYGSRVAFPVKSIHLDEDLYTNAQRYDPFRFSAPREAWEAAMERRKNANEATESSDSSLKKVLEFKNTSMVTVSKEFLGFGNGKHACPGRFFASNEIKILLAYMFSNYDVQPLAERPVSKDFANVILPSTATIRVRRRKISA